MRETFALTMLILLLLSAVAEARYMLDANGRWVKCGLYDAGCRTVAPLGTVPSPPVSRVGQPQPAPPPQDRMK